jgi:2-keto-3-deoxy-L-fuconate dehydrogenase
MILSGGFMHRSEERQAMQQQGARDGRLADRVAVVTAAGNGIGRATAAAFAREGALVFAVDRDMQALETLTKDHSGITVFQADATDPSALIRLVGLVPHIDILFNAVGIVPTDTILDFSDELWDSAFATNVKSMARFISLLLPTMLRQPTGGSIINVASVASSIKAAPNRCVYATTKAAVIGLTKSVAADFIGNCIRCNAICPGTIDTPSLRQRIAAAPDPEKALAAFLARQPMGRFGTDEEVAALAVYLASDESRFTTGSVHITDGGWSL